MSETSLTVGAAVSLTNLITLLQTNAAKSPNFAPVADHLLKIANVPVRNLGTWAGNVMMACAHEDFPSDVLLLLTASQATVTTGNNVLHFVNQLTCVHINFVCRFSSRSRHLYSLPLGPAQVRPFKLCKC